MLNWVGMGRTYSLYDASAEELASILKLSHEWNLPGVKNFAVRELQKKGDDHLDPLSRINLYERYRVDRQNLEATYHTLVCRADPLTLDEARIIGLETALRIHEARELAREAVVTVNGVEIGRIVARELGITRS